MKHIKTYENSIRKLKLGDYILVKTSDNRIKNEVMTVTEITYGSNHIMAELPDVVGDYAIYYSEILRRLTDDEVAFHSDITKYNL